MVRHFVKSIRNVDLSLVQHMASCEIPPLSKRRLEANIHVDMLPDIWLLNVEAERDINPLQVFFRIVCCVVHKVHPVLVCIIGLIRVDYAG